MLDDKYVLIIEDERLIADLLEEFLHGMGCRNIQKISEVDKAAASILSCRPDLVILDMNLRGKSGHPIAQKLHGENVPFVISSGYSAVEFEWQSQRTPIGGFFAIPYLRSKFVWYPYKVYYNIILICIDLIDL